ncbi:DUF6703 family protein [Oryzobacter terrae]|uniref:DUF6703 family protein n=1 Tax=Oryzobacter terrae TaxID=1620385 RepID=UPI003670ACFD
MGGDLGSPNRPPRPGGPCPARGRPVRCSLVSTLRESFERVSLPALTRLSALPRFVPFLLVLGLIVAGVFVPGWGWALILLAALVLLWILALAWPRLTVPERMMRVAVVAMLGAVIVTQAFPRT